jgi:hypothetical protein
VSLPHQVQPRVAGGPPPSRVWYASYGSNMNAERLRSYIAGGRVPGADHFHPGCREKREPERSIPLVLPGQLYFAARSVVWDGASAFYDPLAEGAVWARAHLVSASQFADIAAQEMHRQPGEDLDLTGVLTHGRARLGPGRYETLVCPGLIEGLPVLTFTAPWRASEAAVNRPSARYVQHLVSGLAEAGAWKAAAIADYIADCPGAAGAWTAAEIAALMEAGEHQNLSRTPGPAASPAASQAPSPVASQAPGPAQGAQASP